MKTVNYIGYTSINSQGDLRKLCFLWIQTIHDELNDGESCELKNLCEKVLSVKDESEEDFDEAISHYYNDSCELSMKDQIKNQVKNCSNLTPSHATSLMLALEYLFTLFPKYIEAMFRLTPFTDDRKESLLNTLPNQPHPEKSAHD